MRRTAFALSAALVLAGAALAAPAAQRGRFTLHGTVTRIADGPAFLDVRLDGGKRDKVLLIGVDAPVDHDCYGTQALGRARALALRKHVTLTGDPVEKTRYYEGSLLAYATLPKGVDLGHALIREGFARARPGRYGRVAKYQAAEREAQAAQRGIWRACTADLSVTLDDAPDPVPVGTAVTYTAVLENAGPAAAPES